MKCPKCGYLGFKHVERCPNCGYDFSLSTSPALPDLSIRSSASNTPQPLADLALVDAGFSLSSPEPEHGATPGLGSLLPAAPTPELPLFGKPIADDVPLITRASTPRTPLAVRRSTPEVPRLRTEARSTLLDVTADGDSRPSEPRLSRTTRRSITLPMHDNRSQPAVPSAPAALSVRMLAAIIDVVLVAGIDLVVVYFTMQIVGVGINEVALLPRMPMLAFLTVQNFSYFVLLTASGQTMGQMTMGIKVIADDEGASPDLSRAILRTVVWTILAVPAGLGLATALFSRDHRGLHDRFSGTRVVRASA